ncbi:carboxylesterase family protein [Pseudoxanthomonas wuyuanensis]
MRLLRLSLTLFALCLLSIALSACQSMPSAATGVFVKRELSLDGITYRYQVFVPASRFRKEKAPVVLFLHGSGERGSDGEKQLLAGLGPYLQTHADSFPAIVVFPQSPEDSSWDGAVAQMALATLEAASAEFGGDPQRTYATGMSRGGYGTWELALLQPQRFAALVPICGGITAPGTRPDLDTLMVAGTAGNDDPFAAAAQRLRGIPAWIFHGGKDDVVPPAQSRRMYAALKAEGANVQYTEFPDASHNAWDATYQSEAMWRWLFAQRRP